MKLVRKHWVLLLILLAGAFLRLYRLPELMPFIADQGWYYMSARDMLLKGDIPLVGITSSHAWLHQGAFWTYILALMFKLFNFNPVVPAYFIASLGIVTIALVYKLAGEMFSKKIALVSAFLFATSPLIIMDARFAYHTSPIPFFTALLLLSIYRWTNGNIRYFPFIVLLLGVLYNLEIATFSLVGIVLMVLFYGFIRRKTWSLSLVNKKTIFLSVAGFFIPMIPMLLYDLSHGFPQTVKVVVWIFYRIAVFMGYPQINPNAPGETWHTFFPFAFDLIQKLIFLPNVSLSLFLFLISLGVLSFKVYKNFMVRKNESSYVLILLFVIIPTLAYIAAKTNSSAYLLIFYPQVVIMMALFFGKFMKSKQLTIIVCFLIIAIGFINSYLSIKKNYLTGPSFTKRIEAANYIIKEAGRRPYNIVGKGEGSIYESFVMPHAYLTWWLGDGASGKNENLKFYVWEYIDRIVVKKSK
ncbi:MAG: hypothetical protein ACD_37C00593G0003 [uncultured bacterium]|nr:MAG: hypothetical protein ACD_37C00593G0003 [uncultured bacterium]